MNKLERKFGKYAIPNLMFYIIILYIVGFLLRIFDSNFYANYLSLDAEAILKGQVWRLVTFIIQPPPANSIFMIFAIYLYYMIGRQLEYAWGTFKFNLYFFMGVVFNILATFVVYLIFGISLPLGTYYLNTALFLSYAALVPNQTFYLFFIIPIKVKWLAWLEVIFYGDYIIKAFLPLLVQPFVMDVVQSNLPNILKNIVVYFGMIDATVYQAAALEIFMALLNFVIFFFATRKVVRRTKAQVIQKKKYEKAVKQARPQPKYENGAKHRCHVCGRTELDDDTLEFRYCSKCNGDYEYCQDHLFTHEHVK